MGHPVASAPISSQRTGLSLGRGPCSLPLCVWEGPGATICPRVISRTGTMGPGGSDQQVRSWCGTPSVVMPTLPAALQLALYLKFLSSKTLVSRRAGANLTLACRGQLCASSQLCSRGRGVGGVKSAAAGCLHHRHWQAVPVRAFRFSRELVAERVRARPLPHAPARALASTSTQALERLHLFSRVPLRPLPCPPWRSHDQPQDRCGPSVRGTCCDGHCEARGLPCPRLDRGLKSQRTLPGSGRSPPGGLGGQEGGP